MSDSRRRYGLAAEAGGAIDEVHHRRRIGPRIGARVRSSLQYFLTRFLPNGHELAFRNALFDEMALQALNRAFLLQGVPFFFRPIVLGIAHKVTCHAMGHALEEVRP